MFRNISRIVLIILGIFGGIVLSDYLVELVVKYNGFGIAFFNNVLFQTISSVCVIVICAVIAGLLTKPIIDSFVKATAYVDKWQESITVSDLVVVCIGFLVGLVMAYLLGNLTSSVPIKIASMALSVVSYLLFPYICSRIAWKRRTDLTVLLHLKKKDKHGGEQEQKKESLLIVDSSSAVDGRIVDICKIGFISGKLIIPGFVINELSHLADNDDEIKRNRGRRGLDVLTQLRECELVTVEISDKDFEDIEDTDSKLVKLSTELKAGLITVNYNLNKAAKVNDVRVLNINELSEAVKLAIAPGDRLNVKIVKLGKEQNQGIAYLDNGTMIVVKDGSDYYGKECTVCVTTMLQTASGRMVFAEVV